MKNKKNINLKKKKFPFGIFFLLLITESVIALAATGFYFRHTGIKGIREIEKYTKNYSLTLAEAFADVAELSYKARNFSVLKILFQQEIREDTIDEAFFVLNNGKLIVHSSRDIEKELKGNIATDEFAYNVDLILRPSTRKLKTIQFTSYNVMGKKVPFSRQHREVLKKYLYDEIDMLGWLVSKAVYYKNRPMGTINFIIYKDRIYEFIQAHMDEAIKFYKIAQAAAVAISLLISIIILIRYRSIQTKTYEYSIKELERDIKKREVIEIIPEEKIASGSLKQIESPDDEFITIDLIEEIDEEKFQVELVDDSDTDEYYESGKPVMGIEEMIIPTPFDENRMPNPDQIIKDAIPVSKKR